MKVLLIISILILSVSYAFAAYPDAKIGGIYSYSQKGWTGTMKVKTEGKYGEFVIETSSKDQKHGCSFEGMFGDEDSKNLPQYGQTEDDSTHFKIKFSGKTAIISDAVTGGSCGMPPNGQFNGKWVKVK
jgi:hypothetical protein